MTATELEVMARTVRGIEWIAAAEIAASLTATGISLGHRQVTFRVPRLTPAMSLLGTVDDVFLVLCTVDGISHRRDDLAKLGERARSLRDAEIASLLSPLREVRSPVAFDAVASFLGRRNFNRFEMEDAFGIDLAVATGWTYHSRADGETPPPTALTFRIHLVEERAVVGVRLSAEPLHRRRYKRMSRLASLHPPLARALALLAGIHEGALMVDPFCGGGTIVIEAALASWGVSAIGFDIDRVAVAEAIENAAVARVSVDFRVADAAALPLDAGAAARVVSNPPWGRAMEPTGSIQHSLEPFWIETTRILPRDGRCVVLAPLEAFGVAESSGLRVLLRNHIRLFGAQVEIGVVAVGEQETIDKQAVFGAELARWSTARITP